MPINQISTSNTFAQWLVATQALIENQNFVEDTANTLSGAANSATVIISDGANTINLIIETANSNFQNVYTNTVIVFNETEDVYDNTVNVYSNTVNVYSNTVNVYTDIQNYVASAYDTANTVNLIATEANTTATLALITANAALEASNTFFEEIFNLQDETSNTSLFYPTITSQTIGVPEDVFVSSTKLNYRPSTGNLFSITLSSQNVVTNNIVTGTVTASGLIQAQDFNSTSDITLKENIVQIENPLDILENLTGIKFNWKNTHEVSYGLSAQEVEKVLPDIVKIREGGLKGVNYLNIIAILIESVKELKKEIEDIKKHK